MSKKLMVALVIGLFFVTFAPATLVVVAADAPIMVHLVDDGWDDVDAAAGKPPKDPPVQPAQQTPWGITKIGAYGLTNTGSGVIVAVLDTGVDSTHPDLAANIIGGKNYVANRGVVDSAKWNDDNGHGTHVAGTIAAINNNIGVVGVAPQAKIYAVKVLDKRGSGTIDNVIAAIDWISEFNDIIYKDDVTYDTPEEEEAADIDIISMSLSINIPYIPLKTACDNAYANGIVIVAAAGNDASEVDYPAAYPSVIAVSATDSSNIIAYFSSYGPEIDLAAPGVSVRSTYKGGTYATMSGTSMACPHVSGTAALVLTTSVGSYDTDPNGVTGKWDPSEVMTKLYATATLLTYDPNPSDTIPTSEYYGNGLVNAAAASV